MRVPSVNEMRTYVSEYLQARTTLVDQQDFDDEDIKEMYDEVNSKYRE